MDRLDPSVFKKMFRVDRPTFDEVINKVTPYMKHRDEMKATNSSGSPIYLITRLAVPLRWLAGASHLDLCFAWGFLSSSFYSRRGVL